MAGLHAVAVDSGTVLWSYYPQPDCSGGRKTRVRTCATVTGMTGAPTVIAGAVVEGSADGFLRAFDANTGELLFQFDTTAPLITANGVPGSGRRPGQCLDRRRQRLPVREFRLRNHRRPDTRQSVPGLSRGARIDSSS